MVLLGHYYAVCLVVLLETGWTGSGGRVGYGDKFRSGLVVCGSSPTILGSPGRLRLSFGTGGVRRSGSRAPKGQGSGQSSV